MAETNFIYFNIFAQQLVVTQEEAIELCKSLEQLVLLHFSRSIGINIPLFEQIDRLSIPINFRQIPRS